MASGNPIAHLQAKLRSWLEAQPLAVEASVVTVTAALQGAAIGGLMCKFNAYKIIQALPFGTAFSHQVQVFAGRPLVVQACDFAVMAGTYAGVEWFSKKVTGVDVILNSMTAALCSGMAFSLFSAMENKVGTAILLGGGLTLAIHEAFGGPTILKSKTNAYKGYGRDFRRAGLTDEILPLITESTLHAIRMPPDHALRILAHIQRDSEYVKKKS